MKILINGATKTFNRYSDSPYLGKFLSPSSGNSMESIVSSQHEWAADNDAFTNWNQEKFWAMLNKIANVSDLSRFLWVACPDVVGDAQSTINRWHEWFPQIDYLGLPVAFVGQDGLESIPDQIPWDDMKAFFVGGSTDWKLSVAAERFVSEARERGLMTHVGRVNTRKRIRHAIEIGADTIDGRTFSAWSDIYIPKGIQWIKQLEEQKHFLMGR